MTTTEKPLISVTTWGEASKTKPIKAKPINTVLNGQFLSKMALLTLEGTQTLKVGSMVCMGAEGEMWQQTKAKLLAKYTFSDVDDDGWITCLPKPENAVNCYEVTAADAPNGGFSIYGQWGTETLNPNTGKTAYLQYGETGDFICQNQSDPTDQWIVKRKLFLSTYEIKS